MNFGEYFRLKMMPKWVQKPLKIPFKSWWCFLLIFYACLHHCSKIVPESKKTILRKWASRLHEVLIFKDLGSQNPSKKSIKNHSKIKLVFWSKKWWFLDSCSHHFEPKILTQIQSKINAFFIRKNIENLCKNDLILGGQGGSNEPAFRSLDPCWGHPGPPGHPRVPQGGPRHPPESQMLQTWSPKPLKITEKWLKNIRKVESKTTQNHENEALNRFWVSFRIDFGCQNNS